MVGRAVEARLILVDAGLTSARVEEAREQPDELLEAGQVRAEEALVVAAIVEVGARATQESDRVLAGAVGREATAASLGAPQPRQAQ